MDYSKTEGFILMNAYYGSSTYNSKQMSRLVDSVVYECKNLGIETMPLAELESLLERWGK